MQIRLSADQLRAVNSDSRAIVVVAGAGSGKTEVVAHRIERLLSTSVEDDYRILVMSYTVKAADEIRERLASKLGDLHRRVDADTIHGFAYSLLRQYGTRIGLPPEPELLRRNEDRAELLAAWLEGSGKQSPDDMGPTFLALDLARARCEDADYLDDWREALTSRSALDYAAMLDRATELVEGRWLGRHLHRIYEHVIIDEAQNLTQAQYTLLTRVIGTPESSHLQAVLVGDERQSIVGFAGGDRTLIARFASEYSAERIELHTNFRSSRRIVEAERAVSKALSAAERIVNGVEYPASGSLEVRVASSEAGEGQLVAAWVADILENGLDPHIVAPGESTTIRADQIAVLARAAASLRATRVSLDALGIESTSGSNPDDWLASGPGSLLVETIGHRSAPDHPSIKRKIAELLGESSWRWANIQDALATASSPDMRRLAELPLAGALPDFMESVRTIQLEDDDWLSDRDQLMDTWTQFTELVGRTDRTFGNFRQCIYRIQRGDRWASGVRLLTVHRSQGKEFRAVAIVGCNEGQFPDFRARGDAFDDELRTFYVAISRASRMLLLTRSTRRQTRYGVRRTERSQFVDLLPASVWADGTKLRPGCLG